MNNTIYKYLELSGGRRQGDKKEKRLERAEEPQEPKPGKPSRGLLLPVQKASFNPNKKTSGVFPGGPLVGVSPSDAGGTDLIPSGGAKIPHDLWPKKTPNAKQKQYCKKFNKNFKNGPH